MTLNGVIALICVISSNLIALQADYVTKIEDRLIRIVCRIIIFHFWPKLAHLQRDLAVIAKLLVTTVSLNHDNV